MINQNLHRQAVSIDRDQHRNTKLQLPVTDWSPTAGINSTFLAATEFGDACREFPIVFVNTGKNDKGVMTAAPIAVLGVTQTENLFVENKAWRGRYMPAILRAYPFCTGRIDNERFAICMDAAWSGVSSSEGQALFTAEGAPSELLVAVQKQLEAFELEVQRTQLLCAKLVELDLLRDMRIDAKFGDGRTHSVDGFLTIEQERVSKLSDAQALELHKSGAMGLIHAHWISMGNMRLLMDWHIARHPISPEAAAAVAAVATS
jgi:SapC